MTVRTGWYTSRQVDLLLKTVELRTVERERKAYVAGAFFGEVTAELHAADAFPAVARDAAAKLYPLPVLDDESAA